MLLEGLIWPHLYFLFGIFLYRILYLKTSSMYHFYKKSVISQGKVKGGLRGYRAVGRSLNPRLDGKKSLSSSGSWWCQGASHIQHLHRTAARMRVKPALHTRRGARMCTVPSSGYFAAPQADSL